MGFSILLQENFISVQNLRNAISGILMKCFGTPRLIPLRKKPKRNLLLLHKRKILTITLVYVCLSESVPFVALA